MSWDGGCSARSDPPIAVAIVQARLNSQRFPRKMLADLNGKPVLGWVIDRLKQSKLLHQIVVATPDGELAEFAQERGCWAYLDTGDPNNVLGRYIRAANWCNAEVVVRVCGDCPLVDPELVDGIVAEYANSRVDLVTNVARRSFPKGLDVEALHRNTLKRIYHLTDKPIYREHVTLYIYENPALFIVKNISDNGRDHSFINLSVDTERDLDKLRLIVSNSAQKLGYRDIIRKYESLTDVW